MYVHFLLKKRKKKVTESTVTCVCVHRFTFPRHTMPPLTLKPHVMMFWISSNASRGKTLISPKLNTQKWRPWQNKCITKRNVEHFIDCADWISFFFFFNHLIPLQNEKILFMNSLPSTVLRLMLTGFHVLSGNKNLFLMLKVI